MQTNGEAKQPIQRHPERTRRALLDAALQEFAAHGPAGARVDVIASRTKTSKRMIYYYFGSKQELYLEVLKEAYRDVRTHEINLLLERLEPVEALRTLIRSTFTYFEENISLTKIFAYENLQPDNSLAQLSDEIIEINRSAITTLDDVLSRGRASGVFSVAAPVPSALDIHQLLSSLALYRVDHRQSFQTIFGRDMLGDDEVERYRELAEKMIMDFVLATRS